MLDLDFDVEDLRLNIEYLKSNIEIYHQKSGDLNSNLLRIAHKYNEILNIIKECF